MDQKKKKLYLGVIALGGVALLVDRLILSPDAASPASTSAATGPTRTGGQAGGEDDKAVTIPELNFPRDLIPFDPKGTIRDVFAVPDAFAPPDNREPGRGAGSLADGKSKALTADEFENRYTVTAILTRQGLRIAVVEGRNMQIGSKLDGFTLADIEGGEVIFTRDNQKATLSLIRHTRRAPD